MSGTFRMTTVEPNTILPNHLSVPVVATYPPSSTLLANIVQVTTIMDTHPAPPKSRYLTVFDAELSHQVSTIYHAPARTLAIT